jgi:hypothetical protein
MRALWGIALVASCILSAAACRSTNNLAAAIERSDFAAQASEDSNNVTVRVENNDFPDVVVYLVTEGDMRVRLGMATGHNVTTFTIPKLYLPGGAAQLRFLTRPIGGGRSSITDPMMVSSGEEVVLTIMPS